MDPIAHTLFGATLAETGLRRLSRFATPTLIVGANLPDIDAVVTVLGRDTSLLLRRGWTHGVLAMVVLPLLLSGCVWLWNRRRPPDDPAEFRIGWIIALAYLGVWSHPFLDWMNTYGVRLLMPFDGRWFYGDALFIVDPWFWLLSAAAVVVARSSTRRSLIGWGMLAVLGTLLLLVFPGVPLMAKVLWGLGVTTIVLLKRRGAQEYAPVVARLSLAVLIIHVGFAYGLARIAEGRWASEEGLLEAQSNPIPAVPFQQRIVLVFEDHYRVVPPHEQPFDVPREAPDAIIAAALAAPSVAGFANWARFPYWEKEALPEGGWLVTIRDLRYVNPGEEAQGIGLARVRLDEDLTELDRTAAE